MAGGRRVWVPKKVGETTTIPFDFASDLSPGETVIYAVSRATVYSGELPLVVLGAATIVGTVVNQSVSGGVAGVIYGVVCRASTSEGQVIEISAYCVVEPDLP
jgi:hypothetical protein